MPFQVIQFSLVGGSNAHSYVKRVMSAIITNDFAKTINWTGKNGKIPASGLKILKAVIGN